MERHDAGRPQGRAAPGGPADPRTILRARARELAREIAPPDEGERLEVVEFRLGRERFALEAAWVREVFVPRAVVRVPGAPPFIAGVVNLRGTIVSVVDLRRVLGLPPAEEQAAVVLFLGNGEMEFGVLADAVEGARDVRHRDLSPPLPTLPEAARHFQSGIFPGPVSLLDVRLLLTSPHLRVEQREEPTP